LLEELVEEVRGQAKFELKREVAVLLCEDEEEEALNSRF
jgi:hypothetical protein